MSEQNTEFDPMDRNQDGKVSVKERLQEAADKAIEAAEIAAGVIKDEAMEIYGKVKDYQTLSPEEKKAKQEEWKDTAKDFAEGVKEDVGKLFKKQSVWMLPEYLDAIRTAGGIPLVLPLYADIAELNRLAGILDGFLFTTRPSATSPPACFPLPSHPTGLSKALFCQLNDSYGPSSGIPSISSGRTEAA